MKTLRVITAAFMVLLGAMLIVAWAVAGRVVERIDSGEAATNITQKLLAEPELAEGVANRIQLEIETRVADTPLRFLVSAFEAEIHDALVSVLTSDAVTEVVTNSVGRLEQQITDEVTDPNRPEGPFVVTINPSERINARLDEVPVVGFLIPEITVEPITVELIEAETFEDVRSIYQALNIVAMWAIWAALLLIIAGFWVAPRSRWYWAQAAVGAGFIVLAVSFAISRLVPSSVANAVPGGAEGGAGKFLSEFVSEHTIAPMTSILLGLAFVALVLAVLFALAAKFMPRRAVAGDAATAPLPAAAAPVSITPAVVEPVVVEPAVAEPAVVEPAVVETVVVEPVAVDEPADTPLPKAPTAKKPAAKKPAAKKPAAKKPAATKPAAASSGTSASGSTPAKPPTRSRAQKPKPPAE